MGRFDRYPANIQIEVKSRGQLKHAKHDTLNLSTGGLAFRGSRKLKPGDVVEVRIPFLSPPFETEARVAWCAALQGHHDVGVEFLGQDDAYTATTMSGSSSWARMMHTLQAWWSRCAISKTTKTKSNGQKAAH